MATTDIEKGQIPTQSKRQLTSEQVEEEAQEDVQKYTFFDRKLRTEANKNGDIYDSKLSKTQKAWRIDEKLPDRQYLRHVKRLSKTWPTLGLLADFMEIGTSPMRWDGLKGENSEDRKERISRTEVTRLDYMASGKIVETRYQTSQALKDALSKNEKEVESNGKPEPGVETDPVEVSGESSDEVDEKTEITEGSESDKTKITGEAEPENIEVPQETGPEKMEESDADKRNFRLFIVEDLSRDVIEMLGSHFDIEPHFFREHIFDYAWYNTRDRWAYPPRFNMSVRKQRWMQLRFTTARYFRTAASFKQAVTETERFNVYRRTEDDTNNRALWDEKDAKVGISRTRTSFWVSDEDSSKGERVGILLVDPTIKAGFSLWFGYGNWEETPKMKDPIPKTEKRVSMYEEIIYWAQKPAAVGFPTPDASSFPQVPIQALLYLVASEWLIMSEYIKTRLGQIEWEISYPEHFLAKESNIDVPLKKLHIWRRLVPLYREMLNETLQGVFKFPCHTMGTLELIKTSNPPGPSGAVLYSPQSNMSGPKGVMQEEFTRALSYMEEYQGRIDRLTSVVTAIISIGDSRHSQEDNRNVARLTWLATFFIPLTFVSGLFSMTDNIRQLGDTFKWYAAAAIPLACISLGWGVILTLPMVQKWWGKKIKEFEEWWEEHRPQSRKEKTN